MARCINLDAHEAKTAADGRLRVILRPVTLVDFRPSDDELFEWMYRDRQIRRGFPRQMWNYVKSGELPCPHGSPGDVVVLREKHAVWDGGVSFAADITPDGEDARKAYGVAWRSSAEMPARLARFRPTIERVEVVGCTLISRQDAIGAGATRREWGRLTPFGRDYGWSMGWLRLGQLSRYAGGIHARNDKQPLREQDISLGSPQFAVRHWWTKRWGKKYPWGSSWAWKLTLDWKRGEG